MERVAVDQGPGEGGGGGAAVDRDLAEIGRNRVEVGKPLVEEAIAVGEALSEPAERDAEGRLRAAELHHRVAAAVGGAVAGGQRERIGLQCLDKPKAPPGDRHLRRRLRRPNRQQPRRPRLRDGAIAAQAGSVRIRGPQA